ncbi:MAG: hypothetical protein ACRDZ8_01665 [Acidimicrobiales bacterium]
MAEGLLLATGVRRRWWPGARPSLVVTVVALVWLCWALVLGQLLGALGALQPGWLLLVGGLTAAPFLVPLPGWRRWRPGAALRRARGAWRLPHPDPRRSREDRWLTIATVAVVLTVAAVWVARTVIALHSGINDPDSLGYHLPFIATFAHSGSANQHQLLIPLYPVQLYPANDELLSAIALLFTRSMVFAVGKNLAFGALILVEAHALGDAYRSGRLAVAAAAVVLGFPVLAFSQPGEAVNDALMLLVLLGGLAVLAHARDRPAPYVLAMGAAGLALGVKFSAIVPAAALVVVAVVLLLARTGAHRGRSLVAGVVFSAATGASWYVRNIITYANPVPPVKVAFGPLRLKTIDSYTSKLSFSVGHYLARGQYLSVFAHGLVKSLGPVGVVVAVVSVVVALALARSGDGFLRGLSAFVVIATIGYVTTPAGAAGLPSQIPYAFIVNMHYAAPALLVAATAAAVVAAGSRWAWIFPTVGVVAVLTSIGPGQRIAVWAPQVGGRDFLVMTAAAAVGVAAVAVGLSAGRERLGAAVAAVALIVGVAGAAAAAERYPRRSTTDAVVTWAAHTPAASIGAWNADIADLYGPHARNRVTVLARLDDGGAVPIDTCQGWKQAIVAGHYQYSAVISGTAWMRWLDADPAFRRVAHDAATTVYQVVGPPDVSCPGQSNAGADFWLAPGYGI